MNGKSHLPSNHAGADVIFPAVAQNGSAQLLVDILDAGACIVGSSKLTGLDALRVFATGVRGYCPDQSCLELVLIDLVNTESLGALLQPVQVVGKRLHVNINNVKFGSIMAVKILANQFRVQVLKHGL